MVDFDQLISTDGTGIWSKTVADVKVVGLEVTYTNDDLTFGSLNVYFDTESWDVNDEGLIYTDSGFLDNLQNILTKIGLNADGIGYSEAGMQGRNYVNFDVDEAFLASWEFIGHPLPVVQ